MRQRQGRKPQQALPQEQGPSLQSAVSQKLQRPSSTFFRSPSPRQLRSPRGRRRRARVARPQSLRNSSVSVSSVVKHSVYSYSINPASARCQALAELTLLPVRDRVPEPAQALVEVTLHAGVEAGVVARLVDVRALGRLDAPPLLQR